MTKPDKNQFRASAFLISLTLLSMMAMPSPVAGRTPQDNVLGIRIGMSRDEVHRRLQKLGEMEREVRGRQEVWKLSREPRLASILVGFDTGFKVRYVTAISRDGGPRMRYDDIGPLKDAFAERANGAYTRYTWEIKADKKRAGYFLIAEGRDPEYLRSYSIKQHN